MIRLCLCLLVLLTACSTDQLTRLYNQDDLQDPACYGKFGGEWGYCDKPVKGDK